MRSTISQEQFDKFGRNLLVLFRVLEPRHGYVLPPITSESIDEVTDRVQKEWMRLMDEGK